MPVLSLILILDQVKRQLKEGLLPGSKLSLPLHYWTEQRMWWEFRCYSNNLIKGNQSRGEPLVVIWHICSFNHINSALWDLKGKALAFQDLVQSVTESGQLVDIDELKNL